MRTKKNIIFLTENGMSNNVISKLTEKQVKLLIEKFKKSEAKEVATKTEKLITTYEIPNADLEKGAKIPPELVGKEVELQKTTQGVNAIEMSEDQTINFVDDPSATKDGMPTTESEIKEKFESKAQQGLFWARCNKCSSKNCKWCKMAKEFSDDTSKKQYKKMPKKKNTETNKNLQKFLEKKISEMVDNSITPKMNKKDVINTVKNRSKKIKSMIIRKPKKMTMFSDESHMELPIGQMFSIGKK